LGRIVTVSLEGSEVKIIHSSKKWKTIHIDEKEMVTDREFDAYLDREKSSDFVVVCNFDEYFHDVLLLPELKQKYIKKIVESEIRKVTGKTDFTFVYSILGDKVVDNKKMLEVFYYMVTDEAMRKVVERFYDHGKIVKALYPAVFTAAALLDRKASKGIKMGMIISGYKRTLFTTKNGIVNFVRDYNSIEMAVTEFDIQNINKTIVYCSQHLRIEPSSVTFLGNLSGLLALETKPAVPVVPPDMPDNIECSGEATCDYSLSCGALNVTRRVSILNDNFKNIYLLRRLLEGASLMFVLLSVIFLGLIFYMANDVYQTRHDIRSVVSELPRVERDYGEYLKKQKTMKDVVPFVDFFNRPSIDIQTLLIGLSKIELQQLKFVQVDAQAEGDESFLVTINGRGIKDTYSSFQASFERLVEELGNINNVELRNKAINHMDKTFLVQLHYGK